MSVLLFVGAMFVGLVLGALSLMVIAFLADNKHAKPAPAPRKQLDPIVDMLETKAAIRTDELIRWAEAWQRAALLPDLNATIRDIQTVEATAVIAHRKLERERERFAFEEARAAEQQERERQREERERQAEQERQERRAHEADLAARRARYAERKRRERQAEMHFSTGGVIR